MVKFIYLGLIAVIYSVYIKLNWVYFRNRRGVAKKCLQLQRMRHQRRLYENYHFWFYAKLILPNHLVYH